MPEPIDNMPSPTELEAHVDATAALIGLPLAAEHRPGVLHYFGIAAGMAALVMAHPLTNDDEPAGLFVPVSPVSP